ncbi:MAG: hypothetical protein RL045_1643, partial [Bacteroidota bacterium]
PNSDAARMIRIAISPRLAINKLVIFFTYDFGIIENRWDSNKNAKYIVKFASNTAFYLVKLKKIPYLLGSLPRKIILPPSSEFS